MKHKVIRLLFYLFFAALVWRAHGALAFSRGEAVNFNVDPEYDYSGRSQIKATLMQVGDKALYYVDDDWWTSLGNQEMANDAILSLLVEFDRTIYPRLNKVYGSEWSPGIDNEIRIVILLTRLRDDAGAYFNSIDEYSRSQMPVSNEREMIYLNGTYLTSSRMKSYLAHEFQHLINFYQKEKLRNLAEDVWLNEARSEYASTICGYDNDYKGSQLEKRVNEFLRNPSDSLTEWQNETADYAPANLFMQYLVGRYSEAILTKMMQSEAVGIASIDAAFKGVGLDERFADVFTNWTVTNYVNDCQLGTGQKFCYLSAKLAYAQLHLNPTLVKILEVKEGEAFIFSDYTKDWAAHWYKILSQGAGLNLILNFSGEAAANFHVPILVYYNNGSQTIRDLNFDKNQQGQDLIFNFGNEVRAIILIPSSQEKVSGFSFDEPVRQFSYSVVITASSEVHEIVLPPPLNNDATSSVAKPNYPDGSLIRAQGDYKVYVISGGYKRWLQSPEILFAYPHLNWQSIIEVTPAERDWYKDSWLIRAAGDFRVYEINGDLSRHWLNMTAEQFSASGRSWDMVFLVNKTERDIYRTGAEVMK